MDDRMEVIDAFVDGERVDAAALKIALSDAAGRDYFVDTWLLREAVQDELGREPVPQSPAHPRAGRRWVLPAIAATLAGLLVGGVAGYQIAERGLEDRPAETAKAAPAAAQPAFPAPPATRAIPVEFRGGD